MWFDMRYFWFAAFNAWRGRFMVRMVRVWFAFGHPSCDTFGAYDI
jgi:hypothetical protein